MMLLPRCAVVLVVVALVGGGRCENGTALDTCDGADGVWGALLEDWATAPVSPSGRHGRIMALPPANGYYVTERIDGPFVPPPPPPQHPQYPQQPSQHPQYPQQPPQHGAPVPLSYSEWENSPLSGGKIVNRPPSPYKDKFKPSYAPPAPSARPPRPPQSPGTNAVDRVDAPPGKQVSETDLYLLGAIEKLVYRVDLMEKRLRRVEESVHYLVVGADTKPEPCPANFTRVGSGCYQWSRVATDWKGASTACRRQRAALVELLDHAQRRVLLAKLLADNDLTGNDFWTGGLNPGLLWIWSHSARPVELGTAEGSGSAGGAGSATNTTMVVQGSGRCLALSHDPAARTYTYRGRDCAATLRYICQKDEDRTKLAEEVHKAARALRLGRRRADTVL